MDDYKSQWALEKAVMEALNIQNMEGIAKLQITLEPYQPPQLIITRIIGSELEGFVNVLEKYDVNLTTKDI